ncbi:DUF4349 domain-containing protein [Rhodococcus sp. CX]|uniref:DUF4349 domain-containing protein n=1 Tax=Rhodococcus sp. CX TaxID=2789880 RepID=UPI0018CF4ED2|nr:DUF4349 domain-containing protein [Rhodococcus sp. CX]MBH0122849.1 DUF4349 domain-containing protein [Rhodococcus sp. CX]
MNRLLVVLLTAIALLATGCGGTGSDSGSAPSASMPPSPSLADGTRESAPADTQATDRKEIVTGHLMITADDPIAVGRQVVTIVEDSGGRVDSVTEQPGISSVLTVRVPADRLEGTIDELRGLGEVTSLTTTRDDVTLQYTDLEARISALQASVDRLRALMESAANTADLIEAENALADRQAELDSLTAQQRYLSDQIDLSTLTVDISAEPRRPDDRDSFWDGVLAGWDNLRSAIGDSIVALGVALPWIVFFLLGAGIVYLIVRLLARIGRRRPGTPGTPAETPDENPKVEADDD